MIIKLKNKGLEELFIDGNSKRVNQTYHKNIIKLLDLLHGATEPRDLVGVAKFHPLKGDRKGSYSMHVSGNWVLTFRFDGANVTDVDFESHPY
jgi:proteic killer suppression protein